MCTGLLTSRKSVESPNVFAKVTALEALQVYVLEIHVYIYMMTTVELSVCIGLPC